MKPKICLMVTVMVSSLFWYTMDSSNKDMTVDCNPLKEFGCKNYSGNIVLLDFCKI